MTSAVELQYLATGQDVEEADVTRIIGGENGAAGYGYPRVYTNFDGIAEDGAYLDQYALTVLKDHPDGKHFNIPNIMHAEDTGVTIQNLTVADLTAGDAEITNLEVLGTTLLDGPTTIGNNAALDTLIVNAITAMRGPVTIQNAALTTLASFVVTAGAQTATFGPAATPNLYADVQNGRTMIGSTTALTSANNDKLSVIGGSMYVASATDQLAIGVRYAPTATGSFFFGAGGAVTPNTPDGVFSNSAGTQRARILDGGGLIVGAVTAMVAAELLLVKGGGRFEGQLVVSSGGASITGGVTAVTGGLTATAGGLTVTAGGATITAGDVVVTAGLVDIKVGGLLIEAGGAEIHDDSQFTDALNVGGDFFHTGTGFGVFGAGPAAQQTGGAATADLAYSANERDMLNAAYSALRAYGLIT